MHDVLGKGLLDSETTDMLRALIALQRTLREKIL